MFARGLQSQVNEADAHAKVLLAIVDIAAAVATLLSMPCNACLAWCFHTCAGVQLHVANNVI